MRGPLGAIVLGLLVGAALLWLFRAGPSGSEDAGTGRSAGSGEGPQLEGLRSTDRDAKARRSSPEPSEPVAVSTHPQVRAHGRVVDTRRRPVADVDVIARDADGVIARTTTDPAGRFSIELGPRPEVVRRPWLVCTKGALGARQSVYLSRFSRTEIHLRPIVLAKTHALRVRVEHAGAPVAGARVVVVDELAYTRPSGHLLDERADAVGRLRVSRLVAERVRVFGHADGLGRGVARATLPHGEGELVVELPADRSLTVHVVNARTKEPVPDAEVFVGGPWTGAFPRGPGCLPPLSPLRTDASGSVVVTGLPAGRLTLAARAPGLHFRSMEPRPEYVVAEPDASEATVLLDPYRTLRFPIADSAVGAPDDGTPMTVMRYQPLVGYDEPTVAGRVEDGHVVIEPFPPGFDWGRVVAPDGRWAQWRVKAETDLGDPLSFRVTDDVVVNLTWTDGTPAAGEWLWLSGRPRDRKAPAQTDAAGRAVFSEVRCTSAHVMWTPRESGFGTSLAQLDLPIPTRGTTIRIPRPIDVALAIRIDGEARLPTGYTLYVPARKPHAHETRQVTYGEIDEDPDAGVLGFRWLPPDQDTLVVTFQTDGYPETNAPVRRETDGVWRGTVDLHASAALHVRVDPPEDKRYYLRIEQWDEQKQQFVWDPRSPAMRTGTRAENGVHRYVGLKPGRYRVVDHHTRVASAPVELVPGGEPQEIAFDLSATVLVRGRVVAPEGHRAAFAVVLAHVVGPADAQPQQVRLQKDGTFVHRAIRGTKLRFTMTHPVCKPVQGAWTVVAGQDDPTLRLATGATLSFRVEGLAHTSEEPHPNVTTLGPRGPVRVRLAKAGAFTGEETSVGALATKGLFRVGVPSPGRWSVRVEMYGRVPVLLPDVVVGEDVTDLGTLALSEGATLTIRLRKGDAALPQFVAAKATWLGAPSYVASGFAVEPGNPPVVRIRGLAAGRFRVTWQGLPGTPADAPLLLDREVESDGATPIAIDLRLP